MKGVPFVFDRQPEGIASPEQLLQESRAHLETAQSLVDQQMSRASLAYASRAARQVLEAYHLKTCHGLPAKSPAYDCHLLRHAADRGVLSLTDELLLRSLWYVSEYYDYILAGRRNDVPIKQLLGKLQVLLAQLEAAVLPPIYAAAHAPERSRRSP
jgi:hypothetical protein